MKTSSQLNIADRSGYSFSNMTNINDFDSNLLNIDEVSLRNDKLIMYDIKYIKNLNIKYIKKLNTLYFVCNNLDGYF